VTAPPGLRIVLFTAEGSHKVTQMLDAWAHWRFRPAAVFVEGVASPPFSARLRAKVRADGVIGLLRRATRVAPGRSEGPSDGTPNSSFDTACRELEIPVIRVGALASPQALDAVRALRPDLAIHAGAGILRAPVLAVPRLGTLNAHMGILPDYRGMNVAEWAVLRGDAVGCTVHLIDPGIDTGDIIRVDRVDLEGVKTIAELRAAVDRRQIELLGEVVREIAVSGQIPARRPQTAAEGRQYFRMHPLLREMVTGRLSRQAAVNR
jgi:methionyl-tRNA formyltransferase